MKVVILAGGYGTRFGRVTDFLPKPMIPIGPFPILWHIMRYYSHFGFNEFVVCAGYKSKLLKEFFCNLDIYCNDVTFDFTDGPNQFSRHVYFGAESFRPKVTVAYTGQDTQTGSRVARIKKHLGDDQTFMLTYGDGLSNINIRALLDFHRSHNKLATLTAVHAPPRFGNLTFNGNLVSNFEEKSGHQAPLVNGGFYVFERGILDLLTDETRCTLEHEPLEKLAADSQLMSFKHEGYWQCMDTTRDLESLQAAWASGQAPWKLWANGYHD